MLSAVYYAMLWFSIRSCLGGTCFLSTEDEGNEDVSTLCKWHGVYLRVRFELDELSNVVHLICYYGNNDEQQEFSDVSILEKKLYT